MLKLKHGLLAVSLLAGLPALAASPVKIGLVTTLSGPGGYLGEDLRDGFKLAIRDGKLGGVPVELLTEDDGQNPGKAKQIVERFMTSDNVKIITGIIYTNITLAAVPDIMRAGAIYLSANTGPNDLAGKACNKNYFVVGAQNNSQSYAAGEIANRLGFKRMILLAPNYQAGKEFIGAFKNAYKGEVLNEIYTKLDQTDFSAEDAQIRAAKPDGVFQFLPGALGIASLKQYSQAGLKETIPIEVHAMDGRILAALGETALGVPAATDWNPDFDNPANKRFVADYEKAYGRAPSYYAAHAYDVANLVAGALKEVGGDVGKDDAFRVALAKANFESVRGSFKFAQNQHPVTSWYMTKVVKDDSGKLEIKTVERVLTDFVDPFAKDCAM